MKFLLIDDHALIRQGLRQLLGRLAGSHTFLEAESCEAAIEQAGRHPDIGLILLDLTLPGMHGLDALSQLRTLCPGASVVLVSANDNPQFVIEGIRRGAKGFIPKSASPEVTFAALQVVLAGGTYVPAFGVVSTPLSSEERGTLTARQQEVLQLLMQDKSNKEIAEMLGMRVNTVRVHVAAILRILGVESRVEAARAALSLGLVANGR